LDCRPHPLHDRLFQSRRNAGARFFHPGPRLRRAAPGRTRRDRMAPGAGVSIIGCASSRKAQATKQSRVLLAALDRFAEPGLGPRFARTRWLAMTASYFVSGQPLSFAVKKALSPGTTASCL